MMAEQVKKTEDKATRHAPDAKETLGISRSVYALGVSFKEAFIIGTATTLGMIGIFGFGHKVPQIKKVTGIIDEAHLSLKKTSKEWMGLAAKKLGIIRENRSEPFFKIEGATVTTSVAAGYLVSHFAQVTGGVQGLRQADKAIKKYDATVDDNKRLKEANAKLATENAAYRTEIARRDPSFAGQLAKQQAETETQAIKM